MAKFRALVAAIAAALLLGACGGGPAGAPADVEFSSLEELVAAAEAEGTVLLYTDLFENDTTTLEAAFEKAFPNVDLQIQRLGGTAAITRFEEETAAGAPSADVISVAQPDYYPDAIERGSVIRLRDTGVLDLVPDYPQKYILDDLGTALTQAIEAGFAYNANQVPADKVPTSWADLLDPFWTGKVLSLGVEGLDNTNQLVTLNRVAREYGSDFLPKLAAQYGPPQSDLVPMHGAVAAGEGGLITVMSLAFLVDGMKAQGAPLGFAVVSPAYWPIHGFAVSAKPQHPAAARLLSYFMLTPEGGDSLNTGANSFSAYDDIPETFAPPTFAEIQEAKAKRDEILGAFEK